MKRIILFIIGLSTIYFIYKIYRINMPCYLNNAICISEFKYSDSIEHSIYLNNPSVSSAQKNSWINEHKIYPENENGYWNSCEEWSKNSIVCSFQYLVNIPKCTPMSVNKYPIQNWRLKFYEITLLDKEKFRYNLQPYLYHVQNDEWIKKQSINSIQEVLCDPDLK